MKNYFEPKQVRQQFNRIPNGAAFFIPTSPGASTGTGPFIKMSTSAYMVANTIPSRAVGGNQGTAISATNLVVIRALGWMSRSATLPA